MNNTSPRLALNKTDWYKTFRGLAITVLATIITYIGAAYQDWQIVLPIGQGFDATVFIIPLIGGLLEIGRRFVADNS